MTLGVSWAPNMPIAGSFQELGWWPFAIFGAVMVFALLVIVVGGKRADAVRRRRFDQRTEISLDEFIGECRASRATKSEKVSELLGCIAGAIGVRPGQLRPGDRIDEELAPVRGWEPDDSVWLHIDLYARKWGRATGRRIPKGLATIRDLVEAFCIDESNSDEKRQEV